MAVMGLEALLVLFFGGIGYLFLYLVVKAAVRDAIVEARKIKDKGDSSEEEGNRIAQAVCAKCGKKHDIDYPQCPYCGYEKGQSIAQKTCFRCGKEHDIDYPQCPYCGYG
jgi:DNA-directed RNA polymerase subunit RPC12/RpoP